MQQTPPSLFNPEHFVRQTSALKDALQSLSKTTEKPSFLMLEPNAVPNGCDKKRVYLSVLELLEISINDIQEHITSRWKSKYFTKPGTGFHSVEFQNRGESKGYIITVHTELSMQICSAKDAAELTIQKGSQEHQDLLRHYKNQLLQTNGAAPVTVTPTNSESASQAFFDQSPLVINANTSKQKNGITTNCITPTNKQNRDGLESNDNQQYVPEGFFSTFDAEPGVKAALKTLYRYLDSVQGNELPKQVQAFVCRAMMQCENSDLKNNIYTIKQCSAQNTRLRFDNQHFQHIPMAKGKVTEKTRAIAKKANAIKAQLALSVCDDPHQCAEIMKLLQTKLGLEPKKVDASTQTQTILLDMPKPTLQPKRTKRRDYWMSKKASNLFGVHQADNVEDDDANVPDALEQEFDDDSPEIFADLKCIIRKRIDTLRVAYVTADGYRKVLSEKWRKIPVSDHVRFQITQRSRYLVAALEIALLKMPDLSWDTCCQKAIEQVNASEGVDFITSSRTVRNWHTDFRRDSCTFDGLVNRANKTRMPKFLEENPEQKTLIVKYALDNLNKLTMQLMHEYIHNTLLPDMREKLVSELRETLDELEEDEDKRKVEEQIGLVTVDSILKENNLTVLNEETIRQWMHKLGFKYEERKKCFFVDVHEREDVVEDRNAYVKDSLSKDLRRHCWVQKRADDEDLLKLYENNKLQRHQGHKFERNGKEWIEFHVDDHQSFFEWGNENCKYGGELSVRFPSGQKILIRIGQDEAIFKQYHVTRSAWKGNNGEIGLVPKDDGAGVMISAFISRELGFGIDWTDELRDNVNEMRMGQKYKDEEAALEVHSTPFKGELADNPLVTFFSYGSNQEGWWNSYHMICQVEDVVDVLKVVFPSDEYDIELVIDHSQGHDRLRPDGLTVTNMNLLFGGLQAMMRDSQLTSQGDFGPHPRSLEDFYTANCNFFRKRNQNYKEYIPTDSTAAAKQFNINDTQSMIFTEDDAGPFYLTSVDRERYRMDTVIGRGKKKKTADDLRADLDEKFERDEIRCNVCLKGANKKKLVELAELHDIDTQKEYVKIRQGWVGTAKGKLQIAFERGLLDPTKSYDYYSEKGRKDVHESIIEGTSIDKLIQSLRDFREEKTLLQVRAEEMGISVVRSPKCHPEIAGEGIEYSWGVSKNNYRRQPLEKKRGKENFLSLVRESISSDLITKEVARGCSARSRAFMLAYRARHLLSLDPSEEVTEELSNNPICFDLLDKCVKKFRAHRSAIDFDKGFINGLMLDKMLQISSNAGDA